MGCSINKAVCFVNGEPVDIWDVVDQYTGSLKRARKKDEQD